MGIAWEFQLPSSASTALYGNPFLLSDSADSEYAYMDDPTILDPKILLPFRLPTTASPVMVALPAVSMSVVTDANAASFAHSSFDA